MFTICSLEKLVDEFHVYCPVMDDCFPFGFSNPISLFVSILYYYKQVNVIVSLFYNVRSM